MNVVRKVNGWRSLAGILGVAALALGLSLKLEGAPPAPRAEQSREVGAPKVAPAKTATSGETVSPGISPAAVTAPNSKRLTAGKVPSTGLRVLSTTYVDYRDDEGTRRRQAGTLVGPVPIPSQQNGVAAACAANRCSFDVQCDDNNKCTADRCDIIFGTPLCSGWCVHDSVANNDNLPDLGCDNGNFCDGQETCQGATCSIATAPNLVGQSCDSHASCGEVGVCNTGANICSAGNIGEPCNNNEDCDVTGRCLGAPNAGDACDSNADCAPGTCTIKGNCSPGTCTNGIPAICCNDPANLSVCASAFPRCDADSQNVGVGCQENTDCKDGSCERCQDSCLINADCADGRECNGVETCERTCVGGSVPGILCTSDANCTGGGKCLGQCQPGINPCGAGARCSDKRCGTLAEFEECLYDDDCPYSCVGGTSAGQTCANNAACLGGGTCVKETCSERPVPGYLCYLGRCCTPGASAGTTTACEYKNLAQCDAVPAIGGRQAMWYAMDGGEQLLTILCGGQDLNALVSEPWECPKYTSGITQLNKDNPSVYPVVIGPVSDSVIPVPLPAGNGGVLNAIGDDYTFYNAATCVGGSNPGTACTIDANCLAGGRCGSFLAMDALRYVGQTITGGGRLSIDFYDAEGNFTEDVVTGGMSAELGINVVIFTPPLIIAPSGWMVTHVASDFAPSMYFAMASTGAGRCQGGTTPGKACVVNADCSGGGTCLIGNAGGNNPNALWINTWPGLPIASVNNNYLKMCDNGPKQNEACVVAGDCPSGACVAAPGMLAFELIGDKVSDPVGACCEADGDCVDGVVSWVCDSQGNSYLGDGRRCATCNGAPNTGGACRTCVGGGPAGLCTSDAMCSPGTCEPNTARCRTCVGGSAPPGTPCTVLGDCPGGGTCPALGSACSTGLVGQSCTTNASCNLAGLCDLGTFTCSSGTVGVACTSNAQCDVAGTCVAVACTEAAACGSGACCNSTTGACTMTASDGECTGAGGIPQGKGTSCDADSGFDGAEQHCCAIPQYTNQRCMGGPNNLQSCTVDADCRFCVGGLHNGDACTFTSDAEPNGCLDEGHCIANACVGGSPPSPNTCTTDAECPDNSGVCRGRCVTRGTGGDSCEDAFVHVITVPTLGEGPKTITISGNNTPASTSDDEPDTCRFGADPGWWESFSIDKCARIRLDLCCSDPIKQPTWNNLVTDCPDGCGTIGGLADPYTVGQVQGRRGIPYCGEDNFWGTFGPLDAGTYWFPIHSQLAGTHDDYQLHFTVQACPEAACCYNTCSGGPNVNLHCDKNTTCPGGTCQGGGNPGAVCTEHAQCTSGGTCSVTCIAHCEEVEKDVCDDRLGFFLAPPNIAVGIPLCLGDPGPCADGSCCTGPGQCLDQVAEDNPAVMTSAICDEGVFNGVFIGGVRCKGGECVGGNDDGESCDVLTEGQCAPPGECVGTPRELQQASPCPVCTIDGSGNCQRFENDDQFSPSDLSAGSGQVWADDFVLTAGGTLNTVCVSGVYLVPSEQPVSIEADCGGDELPAESQRVDNFRVRVYEDDGGKPGGGNCTNAPFQRCFVNGDCNPGGTCLAKALGESLTSRTKAVVPGAATAADLFRMWTYQLTLTTPITGLIPSKVYWLEVTNRTVQTPVGCTWHWSQLLNNSTQGNQYSAAGSDTNGYGDGSQRAWDMVWCLNLSVAPGGGASQNRACCSCAGGCTLTSLNTCDDASTDWHEDDLSCPPAAGCAPPFNDSCVLAEEVPVGLYSVSSQCGTTDGGNPVQLPEGDSDVLRDVWFFYRPTEDCPLRVDTCSSSQDQYFDSVVAVYHDDANPTQCVCPLNVVDEHAWAVVSSDDGCVANGRAAGGLVKTTADILAGHCYTIRIGGFPGNDEGGRTAADISCGPPTCGDGRRNGIEQCDPGDPTATPPLPQDNVNCRTATPSTLCNTNCTCGAPNPCGDGDIDGIEECDPGTPGVPCPAPSTCRIGGDPKQCTCTSFCSNNNIEEGEECDGSDDDACPGRCRSSEVSPVCQCPPLACGNGRLEVEIAQEDCEFGLCVGGNNSGQPCNTDTGDAFCAPGGGTCNETADRLDCPLGQCRTPNDPLGGCRCGCGAEPATNTIVWDPTLNPVPWPNVNPLAASRTLRFTVVGEPGPSKPEAIKVTMVDLQHPKPANLPAQAPPNFTTYDTRINGVCVGGSHAGHHCDTTADCIPPVTTSPGTCTGSLVACTAAGEANGCARWVGELGTFLESQDSGIPGGTYKAARLQCTPYYFDWKPEGLIAVTGAEITPSSEYSVQVYGASCTGVENGCTAVSAPVTMYTRRSGDAAPNFNPPATSTQPDALDVAAVVNKLKVLPGALVKAITQLQPNLTELNADVNALDIVAVVDAVRQVKYGFSGPCACPSTVVCGALACPAGAGVCVTAHGAGAQCVKTCVGGANIGDPCINNGHCPGSTCGAGFCRDRCGRCTPP